MRVTPFVFLVLAIIFAPLAPAQKGPTSTPQSAIEMAIETRARDVGRTLRCVVCQNQSIEDSDAPLAADMRALVREQIMAGQSDAEIRSFMQARYGDFVLLKPPVQPSTYALWSLPFLLIIFMILIRLKPAQRVELSPQLSEEERAALSALSSAPEPKP